MQTTLFDNECSPPFSGSPTQGHKGLFAFHKYWGKKPQEQLAYLIKSLSLEGDIIVDPFVGSGLVAREALNQHRRFVGCDVNPVAVEMTRLFAHLPTHESLTRSLVEVEADIRTEIEKTYQTEDGATASHYLWNRDELLSVWRRVQKRKREEREPTSFDKNLARSYENYQPQYPRTLRLFNNSRINSSSELSLKDLFTGRALHNIDLIIDSIHRQPEDVRRALLLSLTAASGQMSSMVFAITGRGKTTGKISDKIEVGSWIIGYWRPPLHFEINVWNCFSKRATELLKAISALPDVSYPEPTKYIDNFIEAKADCAILQKSACDTLRALPDHSVSLILTDPPHGDRIPYLELSELWNAILNKEVMFHEEIVVSNARNRDKSKDFYSQSMALVFQEASRVIKPEGFLVVLFNARDKNSWKALQDLDSETNEWRYQGSFPLKYSANSVVQDNRAGSLKTDFALIYSKLPDFDSATKLNDINQLPGWSNEFPA